MIPLILVAAAVILFGSIVLDMALDNAGQRPLFLRPSRHIRQQREDERELARLTAALAPERESLLPEGTWPQRQTPSTLLPASPNLEDTGRHHVGVALGTSEQQARWNSPAGQFWAIAGATWSDEEQASLSRGWWCESCLDDHKDCAGVCACPCTLVEIEVAA